MTTATRTDSPAATRGHDEVTRGLSRLLAETYTLYLKTQFYHWNVTGPMFRALHKEFEEQYRELATAADDVAERIRTLGHPAPGTYKEFAKLSRIGEDDGVPAAEEMIRNLVKGNETVAATAREVVEAAEEVKDVATVDLASRRTAVHEKAAWMLRSMVE